jgi:phenylalanyl-tRNA synthetase beta chain
VVKNDVAVQDILDAFNAKKATDTLCNIAQAIVLFDEYRGNRLGIGEKSLAFRFTLQDTQSTLQDDRIDAAMSAFLTEAQERLDAKLRA